MLEEIGELVATSLNVHQNLNFSLKLATLMKEHLSRASNINQSRIEYFKKLISTGQYSINSNKIAQLLITG